MFESVDLNLVAFLISVCVVVWLFLRNVEQIKAQKIHLYYVSGFLIILLIGVVSFFCVNNDSENILFNYLSFASTLSSIILSVLAIIITVLSNNSVESLKSAIDIIRQLPKEITDTINLPLSKIDQSTSQLQEIVEETKNAQASNNESTQLILKQIEDHLSNHDIKIEEVASQLRSQIGHSLEEPEKGSGNLVENLTEDQVKAFLSCLPNAFIYLIKAVDICVEKNANQYISLNRITSLLGDNEESLPGIHLYFYSACLSLGALNLIGFEKKDDGMNYLKFNFISSTLRNSYKEFYSKLTFAADFENGIVELLSQPKENYKEGEEAQ